MLNSSRFLIIKNNVAHQVAVLSFYLYEQGNSDQSIDDNLKSKRNETTPLKQSFEQFC